ncbi:MULTISPECIES: FadR/GntR family transcriptional regulator [unclassified Rathayibacter]|uniref:FadR/GntR family transcriptional regulator n=1 Tax=unclassified Rathayibacter TaxID=2609250 RepID=UPI000CE7F9A4|nr:MULTISPECIES: FCD domain-containing protein [unclassified Rathayibacter]PPH08426.1 GntR family transcriptional regulator [Rathayibacter sp. AY1C1]PPH18561.1 GntR family transcriptional regulator [Rathayibacter sp. AY1C4]PPH31710.1 GntR family transcriptional regulator [Rathayibacter sp. AY1C3]PPH44268.1 GntR family transcriptional regulator [Rathayibacter sp. AY1C9]PPH60317.1 GntR family transcriptional regulator [Rathayibacter sp. AY1D7]
MNPGESSPAAPFQRESVIDHVTALFHEEIRSGRWAVGERIPVEAELARWTGAGRNSVREAVQALVQAGLVRREQGRGTFVTARSQLAESLRRRIPSAARREGLELRFAIDGATAALAAERRTGEDVAALRALLARRARSWEAPELAERIAADTALHRAVVVATHNDLFVELYDGLTGMFESVLEEDVVGEEDVHARQHAELVEAIAAGDAEGARRRIEELLAPLLAEAQHDV